MPCRSDYMEQSGYEIEISKTVKNLVFLTNELGQRNTPEMAKAITQHSFSKTEGDKWVAMLCAKVRGLSEDQMESIVFARNKKARKLADWWEDHEKADNKRINKDAERREKAWNPMLDELLPMFNSSKSTARSVIKWFVANGYEAPVKSKDAK